MTARTTEGPETPNILEKPKDKTLVIIFSVIISFVILAIVGFAIYMNWFGVAIVFALLGVFFAAYMLQTTRREVRLTGTASQQVGTLSHVPAAVSGSGLHGRPDGRKPTVEPPLR